MLFSADFLSRVDFFACFKCEHRVLHEFRLFVATFFFQNFSDYSCFGAGSSLHVSLDCFLPYKYKLRLIYRVFVFSFLLYLLIVTFKLINYFFVIIYFWGSFLSCCLLSFSVPNSYARVFFVFVYSSSVCFLLLLLLKVCICTGKLNSPSASVLFCCCCCIF